MRLIHGDSDVFRLPESALRSAQYVRMRSAIACRFFSVNYQGARVLIPNASMPGQFFSHALFAAVYGQLGDDEAARREVHQTLSLRPDFAEIARDQFGRWYTCPNSSST